ncbi:MAG TPA: AAA family ATPase [Acidimicrobiales bacterium]|nr:AAA family ATPase [Acidimicrobiales bacterium]
MGDPSLVGRDALVGRMNDAVAAALAGDGRVVLVEGEPGIGKSALLASVCAAAGAGGGAVLAGRGDDLERHRPFRALVDALGLPDAFDVPGYRGADRLVSVVEQIAVHSPVVLALDDVHWADVDTVRALRMACRRLRDLPVAIVLAFRSVPRIPELARLVGELLPTATYERVGPLDHVSVVEIAASVLGVACGPRLAADLARAGGNPLFLHELLVSLDADGLVRADGDVAELEGSASMPPGLAHMLSRHVSTLTPATVDLLRVASILGRAFAPGDAARLLERPVASVLPDFAAAVDAGILADDGTRLRFRHDLIREAIYTGVSPSVRAAMHLDAAVALRAAGASAAEVVPHLELSTELGAAHALDLVREVAEEVRDIAPGPAVRLYERALSATRDPAARDELLAGMAMPLTAIGRLGDAERIAREVLTRTHDAGLGPRLRGALSQALLRSGRSHDDVNELAALAERPDLDAAERLDRRTDLALALVLDGAAGRAAEMAAANLAVAETLAGADRVRARNLMVATLAAVCTGDVPTALRHGEDAMAADLRLARRIPAEFPYGLALLAADRIDEARRALSDGRRYELEEGEPTAATMHHWALAGLEYVAGNWDDALAEIESGDAFVAEGVGAPVGLLLPRGLAARIHLHRGDTAAAHAELEDGRARFASHGPEAGIDVFFWADATRLAEEGDVAGAASLMHMVWNALGDAKYFLGWSLIVPDLVRWATEADDPKVATAVAEDAALGAARSGGVPSAVAASLRCQALVETNLALAEKAVALLTESPRRTQFAAAVEQAEPRGAAPRPAKRPTTGWEALTPTELRVVALVALGRTNPQVATELFVSPRTVETHLSHVFAKLGLSSRVELAAVYARRPLQ